MLLPAQYFQRLLALLQQGFWLRVPAAGSIETLFCHSWGLSPVYLASRIQTIFLNGQPVDSVAALVGDRDTLALSAAMPGLVGATFRKGGVCAPLRAGITHRNETRSPATGPCWVQVKLFNLLCQELGPHFLARGIWWPQGLVLTFLQGLPAVFWTVGQVFLDGRPLDAPAVARLPWHQGTELVGVTGRLCSEAAVS